MARRRASAAIRRRSPQIPRAVIVCGAFLAAMTLVGGTLLVTDSAPAPRLGTGWVGTPAVASSTFAPSILNTATPVKRDGTWTEIIIYDSGSPYGTSESLSKKHQAAGLEGLGYHFVIGNGNGMGNGQLHVGYRWNDQLPGAHFSGPNEVERNKHSIGICLVGNGGKADFTEAQIDRLVELVRGLQGPEALGIQAANVVLDRSLQTGGRFPWESFRARIRQP